GAGPMRVPHAAPGSRTSLPGTNDLRLALFEPDIPQNTGALLRLAACFGIPVDLIEPFGFVFDDRRLKRALLDYAARLGSSPFLVGRVPRGARPGLATGAADNGRHGSA